MPKLFFFLKKREARRDKSLEKACERWGTSERVEYKTWNVISARNARQLMLLRNDAAPLRGNKQHSRCDFSGRPQKMHTLTPQALRESSLNESVLRTFLFETKRGVSGCKTRRERILKFQRWVLISELHVGCEIQLLEARLWETLVCRLYRSSFVFVFLSLCMSCGTTHEHLPRGSVQALWTAEHELWIFGGRDAFQICSFDLVTESYNIFLELPSPLSAVGIVDEDSSTRSSFPKL